MSLDEIQKKLYEIESCIPVELWSVDGVYIWPIVRIKLFEVLSTVERVNVIHRVSVKRKRISLIYNTLDSLLSLLFMKKDIAFSYTHYRALIGKTSYHRFIDSLRMADNGDIDLYEIGTAQSAGEKYGGTNHVFSGYHFLSKCYSKFLISKPHCNYIFKHHKEFMSLIPLSVHGQFDIAALLKLYNDFFQKKEFFDFIFTFNPRKTLFVNTYYSLDFLPIVYSAKKNSIKVIEIQHGVASSLHPAYSNWNTLSDGNMFFFPDEFWFWSNSEVNNFSQSNNVQLGKALSKGNLWLGLWGKLSETFKSEPFERLIQGKDVYLFTLQFEELPLYFFDICDALLNNSLLLVRLHPNQLSSMETISKQLERYISKGMVELKMSTSLPLPYILSHTKKHLTESSTVVIEASFFGVSSVVFSKDALKMYPDLFEQKIIYYCENILEDKIFN